MGRPFLGGHMNDLIELVPGEDRKGSDYLEQIGQLLHGAL